MISLQDRVIEAADYIRDKISLTAQTGMILGTGLSGVSNHIENAASISYTDIPHFPAPTVTSHQGHLIFGYLDGTPVICLAGRFHYYEGYSAQQVAFPVWVLAEIGIKTLILSNASGGTNPAFNAGDIVFIKDHINLHPDNPLRGILQDKMGPRFPDMMQAYDQSLLELASNICAELAIPFKSGVYLGLQGPSLETPAEYAFIHKIGADMVGMSTVHEVIAAVHQKMRVCALSVITNECYPIERITKTTLEDVIAVVEAVEPNVTLLIRSMITKIAVD